MIFKGTGCFQFPEAVYFCGERKPTLYRTRLTTSSRCFLGVETAVYNCTKFGSKGKQAYAAVTEYGSLSSFALF